MRLVEFTRATKPTVTTQAKPLPIPNKPVTAPKKKATKKLQPIKHIKPIKPLALAEPN